jgi:hypothetical protein
VAFVTIGRAPAREGGVLVLCPHPESSGAARVATTGHRSRTLALPGSLLKPLPRVHCIVRAGVAGFATETVAARSLNCSRGVGGFASGSESLSCSTEG